MFIDIKSNRYLTLAFCFLISFNCSINYSFSAALSSILKDIFKSQKQVNQIASIGNIFQFFALLSGIFYDKYTPRKTLFIGLLCVLIGYLGIYFELDYLYNNYYLNDSNNNIPSIFIVTLFYAIGSASQPFLDS